MAIKILSGIIVTQGLSEGRVKIDLDDNELVDAPGGVRIGKTKKIGSRRYGGTPCKIVALREITIKETEPGGLPTPRTSYETDYLKIDDVSIDERYMEIKWEGTGGSRIEEISYMVIGETS